MNAKQQETLVHVVFISLLTFSMVVAWQFFNRRYQERIELTAQAQAPVLVLATPKVPLAGLNRAYLDLRKPDAVDCGNVRAWTKKRGSADACAVKAFKAKKPFRLRYSTYTSKEMVDATIIGNREGHVYFLSTIRVYDEEIIREHLCKHPIIVTINGKRRLACEDKRNLAP